MEKYKLVMVNYLNSKPYEHGLKMDKTGLFDIEMATPSRCASQFASGQADIALIPVGALHDLQDFKIVSDYCIGCDGEVRTVCIFSNEKLEDCTRLLLDNHSKTSFLLSQLLVKEYFNLQLPFASLAIDQYTHEKGDAVLMIGDKVFDYESDYIYKYDLGAIWKQWTGLPFVFAVWVTKNETQSTIHQNLNQAFSIGISHLSTIIEKESSLELNLSDYYNHNIRYVLDEEKKKGLALFLEKTKDY